MIVCVFVCVCVLSLCGRVCLRGCVCVFVLVVCVLVLCVSVSVWLCLNLCV